MGTKIGYAIIIIAISVLAWQFYPSDDGIKITRWPYSIQIEGPAISGGENSIEFYYPNSNVIWGSQAAQGAYIVPKNISNYRYPAIDKMTNGEIREIVRGHGK